jgi:plastocyanin
MIDGSLRQRRRLAPALATLVIGTVSLAPLPARAADHRVGQADKKFSPPAISLRAGDSITFVNDDLTIHNIHSETPGHEFEIKRQNPKQRHTVTFTKPGEFLVECKYHGQMRLKVTVIP